MPVRPETVTPSLCPGFPERDAALDDTPDGPHLRRRQAHQIGDVPSVDPPGFVLLFSDFSLHVGKWLLARFRWSAQAADVAEMRRFLFPGISGSAVGNAGGLGTANAPCASSVVDLPAQLINPEYWKRAKNRSPDPAETVLRERSGMPRMVTRAKRTEEASPTSGRTSYQPLRSTTTNHSEDGKSRA